MLYICYICYTLVHVLSPNIYINYRESLQAFNYFSEVSNWSKCVHLDEFNLIYYFSFLNYFR